MSIDRKEINNLADKIRLALGMAIPPYDPAAAISKLKGEIRYDIADPNIDASVEKLGEKSFCVHLNDDRSYHRQRFTLAHELGHIFLHFGYIINSAKWNLMPNSTFKELVFYRDSNYSKEEYEANEFAAAFLMPCDEFLSIAEENLKDHRYSIVPIAEHFDVSPNAVSNRGKWLGIFQW